MSILTIILGLIIAGIVYALREQLIAAAVFIGIFMGIGALLFWWLFDNASLGATVGFFFALFIGSIIILESLGRQFSNYFEYAYYVISSPIWFLNRLQLILMEPWRYFTKKYLYYGDKLQPWIYPIEIILYILITPLRFVNAVIYNMFVYCITELYDLILEVFLPGSYKEGYGSVWKWIVFFPIRLVKYPIFHGVLVVFEAVVWTVIDIFIPTITLYHGTDLTAAQAIVGNDWNSAYHRRWTDGTFSASDNGWAGSGVYFGSRRKTAKGYAFDYHRLSDNNPVMIVCRVSLGKILNYRLAPDRIHNNAGPIGSNSVINSYAEKNGYTSGEWWNYRALYWEYCLFDWKNRYNHPWRIRPIFVFNFRTGLAQHIDGGFRHWLFSKSVIDDILNSWRFAALVGVAIFLAFFFFFWLYNSYGRVELSNIPQFWSKPIKEYVVEKPQKVDYFVEEPVTAEEPKSPEPVKETPKPVYNPPAKKYSNSGSYSSSKKSKSNRQKSTYKSSPPPNNRPKSKYGFRLEKVDRIPTKDNPSNKKNGFHLEKVDRIPTKDNPSNKKDVDDVYYY